MSYMVLVKAVRAAEHTVGRGRMLVTRSDVSVNDFSAFPDMKRFKNLGS